jgi:formiminoglutamate deiminase
MTTWWCAQAQLPDGVAQSVRLAVRDGRLASVVAGEDPQPGDERLEGLVLPGFANTHSHAFHRTLRGRTHANGGTFWTWREDMYAVARSLTPDSHLPLARAAFVEMVAAGYTVVGEFHYLHHDPDGQPYPERNAMGAALIQAATEAGIRLTLLDTLYLAGGLTADGYQPLDEVQRRYSDGSVAAWRRRVGEVPRGATVRPGVAVHSVRAVPREALAQVAAAVATLREQDPALPLHVHLSEQPAENAACRAVHGCTPTELLADAGLLGPATTAVHATHLEESDIAALGGSGSGVCLCPRTEADLADGIGPARALADAGSPLSIGSDQHAVVDPFVETRSVELFERLASGRRGRFSPDELRAIGAANGYRALGWADGGVLAVGALADFIAVDPHSRRTAGSRLEQILFAAGAPDVTDVVVAGKPVVRGGVHRLGPVDALLHSALQR